MTDREPRLRLVAVTVAAEFVLDDGEDLTKAQFGPIEIPSTEWDNFDLRTAAEAAFAKHQAGQSTGAN